jgi:hypothetical protein
MKTHRIIPSARYHEVHLDNDKAAYNSIIAQQEKLEDDYQVIFQVANFSRKKYKSVNFTFPF